MSNVNDICCNPRLHDLVLAGWPPCCATSFAVVVIVAHAPVIHAASPLDHKKRVAWVPISMHTCGSFFYNYGAPLAGAPLGTNLLEEQEFYQHGSVIFSRESVRDTILHRLLFLRFHIKSFYLEANVLKTCFFAVGKA